MAETRQWQDRLEYDERERVRRWRYQQARFAGLTLAEAWLFADGDGDVELLRGACRAGATRDQLVRIFV